MSCALLLGSAKNTPFAKNKKIGIIMHQKASALNNGLFNNVLGIKPGTTGKEILETGKKHLTESYAHIDQIEREKVVKIDGSSGDFTVITNKNAYQTKTIVVAVGPSNLFNIDGLLEYVEPHQKLPVAKLRIQLKNKDHRVKEGIYVAGVLAGWISQFSIAAGSGSQVATDILSTWNNGNLTMIHEVS